MMTARLPALVLTLFFSAACHSQSANPRPSDRLEIIQQWSGQYGGGATPGVRAVRTAEEWNAFWKQAERPPPLQPDFARHMGVVISLGEKRTGGFAAEILGARNEAGKLIIDYRESSPPAGAMVTQALTSPWVAAVLPRWNLAVVGRKISEGSPQEK